MIPQLISITLSIAGAIVSIVKNGQAIKPPEFPVFTGIASGVISFVIYKSGGFWHDTLPLSWEDWPQVTIFVLIIAATTFTCIGVRAKKRVAEITVPVKAIVQAILFSGGFYDCFFK